jgi:trehalose 6-phosphate phosphatase
VADLQSLSALVEPLRAAPDRVTVVTDFDGTLAPIVPDPPDARPLPGCVEVLHDLAGRYGRVAVVSGRPARFLADQLAIAQCPRLVAYGLYGMEWTDGEVVVEHADAVPWRAEVDDAAAVAEKVAPDGVLVERKGLSVTLHVRNAPHSDEWARSWAEARAAVGGLALHPGRMSYELRPPVAVDKGTVMTDLLDGSHGACFLGDDRGDLPAFDALDRHAADNGAAVVRVAVRSDEAPAELLERADLLVDGPDGVLEFLRALL